jgi:hypothetical protein
MPNGYIVVTEVSHPRLYKALDMISHDGGGGAGHLNYALDDKWEPQIGRVDDALKSLSDEELEEFAIGEQTRQDEIAARSPDLTTASKVFNCFFGEG